MFIVIVLVLLFSGCTTTSSIREPKVTEHTTIEGIGDRGDTQRETEKVRTITETTTRCCGPRGSILDIYTKTERVIREKDQSHEQIIKPVNNQGGSI